MASETLLKNSQDNKPLVSIVIPAYNVAEYLSDALDSVFNQTFNDFEVIVINDGSDDTEALEEKIKQYPAEIKYIYQENSGAGAARNAGIRSASGKFIAFLDADDIWMPDYLKIQLGYLENGDVDLVSANAKIINHPIYKNVTYRQLSPCKGKITIATLLNFKCSPITSGTLVKREAIINNDFFDPQITRGQDFDLWLRIKLNGGNLVAHNNVLLFYRYRENGLTGTYLMEAKRTYEILLTVKNKYTFTESDARILNASIIDAEMFLKLTEGKIALVSGKYDEASSKFNDVVDLSTSFKLKAVRWFVQHFPRQSRFVYKQYRNAEYNLLIKQSMPKS